MFMGKPPGPGLPGAPILAPPPATDFPVVSMSNQGSLARAALPACMSWVHGGAAGDSFAIQQLVLLKQVGAAPHVRAGLERCVT